MNEQVGNVGFMDELKRHLEKLYELASFLDKDVKARGEKYFSYGYKDESEEESPCGMATEMISLITKTMQIVERARKHVLEV